MTVHWLHGPSERQGKGAAWVMPVAADVDMVGWVCPLTVLDARKPPSKWKKMKYQYCKAKSEWIVQDVSSSLVAMICPSMGNESGGGRLTSLYI